MKRLAVLLFVCVTLLASPVLAADRTVYVDGTTSGTPGTNGAHYASLSAAISGEAGSANNDLVAGSTILHIECSVFSGNAADTTAVVVSGFTSDSTHYVHIYTAAASRHAGVWDDTKYRLAVANPGGNGVLDIRQEYTRLEGMQIRKTSSNASDQMVVTYSVFGTAATTYLSDTIIRNAPGDSFRGAGVWVADADVTLYVWNTIIYGFPDVVSVYNSGIMVDGGTVYVYSSTVIGGWTGLFVGAGTTANCKNSYFAETGTDGSEATISVAGTFNNTATCAVSDGDTDVGAGLRNIAVDTTTFTNVTASSEDFRLPGTGSPLYNVGTDGPDSAPLDFTTDITGATRTSTWDIGADEHVAAAAGTRKLILLGAGQ